MATSSASGALVIGTVLHFFGLALYSYGIFFNAVHVHVISDERIGSYMFLTQWNMVFQLMYFFICCISDLVTSSGAHSPFTRKIAAFRDWFLAAVAFPIGTLVELLFWGIWSIDRELIHPKSLDAVFPSWLNHVMHTTVVPILILDMLIVRHRYPSKVSGILGVAAVGLSYLSLILWLGFVEDLWVYPFLEVLSGTAFIVFIFVLVIVLLVIYIVGEKVAAMFWRGRADYDFEMDKLD